MAGHKKNDLDKEHKLIVDPGFVHHRKIETILGEDGTEVINKGIERIAVGTPDWRKNVVIGQIYTRVLIDFCDALGVSPLEQVLLEGRGKLFCSIVKIKACDELYETKRAILKCESFEGSKFIAELHLTTNRISSDTLRSGLSKGGNFAVIAEQYNIQGDKLIFHPLVIGFPYIADEKSGEFSWTKTYSDFYRIHIEDFDEFSKVKDLPLSDSFQDMQFISEKNVKKSLGKILNESTPKDWGGETSDFFTSHLHLKGKRVSAAFLLKGPAKFSPMTMTHLGKNGDQIVRLSKEPVDILVVQHCHDITPAVIETLKAFSTQPSNSRHYCLVEGRESLRLLEAYELKKWAIDESK